MARVCWAKRRSHPLANEGKHVEFVGGGEGRLSDVREVNAGRLIHSERRRQSFRTVNGQRDVDRSQGHGQPRHDGDADAIHGIFQRVVIGPVGAQAKVAHANGLDKTLRVPNFQTIVKIKCATGPKGHVLNPGCRVPHTTS